MKKQKDTTPIPRAYGHLTIQVSYKPCLYSSLHIELNFQPAIEFKDGNKQDAQIVISDRCNMHILPEKYALAELEMLSHSLSAFVAQVKDYKQRIAITEVPDTSSGKV